MNVVILCGGKGTRIRGVDDQVPKPMIRVGDEPILLHIMRFYASFGHRRFVLCLGYKGEVIREFFGAANLSDDEVVFDDRLGGRWRIVLAETGEASMTGARVSRVRQHVGDESFLLTYGDGVCDVNLNDLIAHHETIGTTLTLTAVRPPARFGEVGFDSGGIATSFNEKPQASGGHISGGYFVCSPQLFHYLSDDESLVFERQPMQTLVKERQLGVFQHDGFWQCMDTYRDWELLNELEQSGSAPWRR
jgi:glucose-1-phosphate cytidylyltransferase